MKYDISSAAPCHAPRELRAGHSPIGAKPVPEILLSGGLDASHPSLAPTIFA